MLKKIFLITLMTLFIGVLPLNDNLKAQNCCSSKNNFLSIESQENRNEVNKPAKSQNRDQYRSTRANVTVETISGVSIYRISQNNDSYRNIGYSLGKAIVRNKPNYPQELAEYLKSYREVQGQYMLEKTLEQLSNSMPCSMKEEMEGLA